MGVGEEAYLAATRNLQAVDSGEGQQGSHLRHSHTA